MKQFFKLYKNHIMVAVTSISLVGALGSCISHRPENQQNNVQVNVIKDNNIEVNNEVHVTNEDSLDNSLNDNAEDYIKKYISDIESDESEDAKESKLRNLVDFICNGKELGGYKFSDLTEMAKENVLDSLYSLDGIIDDYIPDYKERLKSWSSKKGERLEEALVDGGTYLKEKWDDYKQKVNENESKVLTKKSM